ncbi:MAG: ZPR1 zinc finger domain-containing protein [Candidatus Helarchaeota archaeon]
MDINKNIDIFFNKINCPICKSKISTHFKTVDIPYFGEVILITLICDNCGYKKNDLFNVYEKGPKRYIYKFEEKKDLNIRVVRSGSCTIKIPELGSVIEPGIESEGYITNIEGILYRISDILTTIENQGTDIDSLKKIEELRSKIEKAKVGKFKLTLILEDPTGNSAIISDDNQKLRIEDLEIKED